MKKTFAAVVFFGLFFAVAYDKVDFPPLPIWVDGISSDKDYSDYMVVVYGMQKNISTRIFINANNIKDFAIWKIEFNLIDLFQNLETAMNKFDEISQSTIEGVDRIRIDILKGQKIVDFFCFDEKNYDEITSYLRRILFQDFS